MKLYRRATAAESRTDRRLHFEFLERRDLLTVIRLVNWNTLNRPNNEVADAAFSTVFDAIANETVQGNTKRLDILALQETDPAGSGGNSIGRVADILDTLYTSTDYAYAVTAEDGGGDSTGFVYDTSTISLLSAPIEVAPASLTHRIMRAHFAPVEAIESDFFVYSIHLKSGDAGSDQSIRAAEAAILRADADALGEGAHVLFVGDFNMQSSFEGGYTNLVASGAGQMHDVADAPGVWNDNPVFKSLHSQAPGAAMDDRFDIQFATGEFFDGVGLEYVSNSYRVFGNNGTHALNEPITTGTGASPEVLAALVAASDHLPVVADYEIVVSTPNVRIRETGGGTKVIEGGLYDTYSVVLDTIPAANVTVTITPGSQLDIGAGVNNGIQLVFTPANALTPQTVIIHAYDDALLEGTHTAIITHSSTSLDLGYDGLVIGEVTVEIIDDDAPTIVINEIDADQTGTDTGEFVELYDGGVGNTPLNGKTLVFFNGVTDTAYRVFAFNNTHFTDANGFFVVGNVGVPNVDIEFPGNVLQNGADAVALYEGPFANGAAVTTNNLLDVIVYDTGQSDDPELLVLLLPGQPQVDENQNSQGTTQSLSRIPDGGAPRQTITFGAKTPTPGALNQSAIPGVLITHSGSRVDVEEGGATDSYQLSLQSLPSDDVTITVDPDAQTDLGLGAGVAIVLVFTPVNAFIPQTVTVAAVDDALAEGNHTSLITHTASSLDSNYDGLAIGNVVANILDNDTPAVTSVVISEIMYDPKSDESSPGVAEWIEIVNTGAAPVNIGGWQFDDEDATNWGAIPANTFLNPGQAAVFFDAAFTTAAVFRAEWSVPTASLVFGISWGSLANEPTPTNEILQLLDSGGEQVDVVNYDDSTPWPSGSDGPSIYLVNLSHDNNLGGNWARSIAGVNHAVSPSGPTFLTNDVGSPGRFGLPGDYNMNGVVDAADHSLWRYTLSSTTDLRADGSGPVYGVPDGVVDQFDLDFWRANFGRTANSGGGSLVEASSAAGSGALAVAAVPVIAEAPSATTDPSRPVNRPSPALDAAWATLPQRSLASTARRTSVQAAFAGDVVSESDSSGLLLVAVTRTRSTAMTLKSVAAGFGDSPRQDDDAPAGVDQFFASLADESHLASVFSD